MTMHEMMRIELQELNEKRFCRKHIDPMIRAWFIDEPAVQDAIDKGVDLLLAYASTTYSYQSKNDRVANLAGMDFRSLVVDVFVGIAYLTRQELFTSVTAQLAGRLGWDDKPAAITTMAEIVAVLTDTDAFDIIKASKYASLYVDSRFDLPEKILKLVEDSLYLPPMVVKPKEVKTNMSSGYLTYNDSLVLGKGNHHDGDLGLDVINLMNGVALSLNTEFLKNVEELPTDVTAQDMIDGAAERGDYITQTEADERVRKHYDNWDRFKKQSYEFYYLMATQGNEFHLTHKRDKRGRMYAQGYHISTQGNAFKKAMIDFAHKEVIDIPKDF